MVEWGSVGRDWHSIGAWILLPWAWAISAHGLEFDEQLMMDGFSAVGAATRTLGIPRPCPSFEGAAAPPIVHGFEISSVEYPYFKQIFQTRLPNQIRTHPQGGNTLNGAMGSPCASVLVKRGVLLTAAHCVLQEGSTKLAYNRLPIQLGPRNLVYPWNVVVAPGMAKTSTWVNEPARELALIYFDDPVDRTDYPPIDVSGVAVGENVGLVGWGESAVGKQDNGVMRGGASTVAGFNGGQIRLTGIPDASAFESGDRNSLASKGDSGGPLLQQGRVVGIMSGSGPGLPGSPAGTLNNFYVDLSTPANQQFLRVNGIIP